MAERLRKILTSKNLTPAELEILNHNFWVIEQALLSVNAVFQPPATSPDAGRPT